MKLPSLTSLIHKAIDTVKRFPLTLLSAATGVSIALYLIENNRKLSDEVSVYFNAIAICGLGLSLFFSIHILMEKQQSNIRQKAMYIIGGLVFLGLVYWSLPEKNDLMGAETPYLRLAAYFISAHLLSAFIPFIQNKNLNGFWQYNRRLFIRFLTAALYSAVLFIGISLALVAISELFDVRIKEERFGEIWVIIAGLFNTWLFLSGVPKDFSALDEDTDYPKGLRVFAQYILLPLLALYMIILYAYGAKIIMQWNWPKGIISYLVICVSVVGSLTFLLLYPYGNTEEHRWIKTAQKGFYLLMLPLLVILFIAISMRLNDYGITIHRYIVFMLGVWLTVVSVYSISGRPNIRFIPMSLTLVILLSIFGPWSMFSVSASSQKGRLENMLSKARILKDGKIQHENKIPSGKANETDNIDGLKNSTMVSDSIRQEIGSIMEYLRDIDRLDNLNNWFTQDMSKLSAKAKFYTLDDLYMNAMGLSVSENWQDTDQDEPEYEKNISPQTKEEIKSIPVEGYQWMIPINDYGSQEKDYLIDTFELNGVKYKMTYSDHDHANIEISSGGKNALVLSLDSMILAQEKKDNDDNYCSQEELTLIQKGEEIEAKLMLSNMSVYLNRKKQTKKRFEMTSIKGWLLLRKIKQ